MKLSIVIAAAAALLALCAVTPVQALAKGDCIVELPITAGALVGLDKSKFVYKAPYTDSKGAAKKVAITVTQSSASDGERGAASGKVAVVFPAGTQCNFTNSALDKKDPGFAALKTALKGLTIGGAPAGSGFGIVVANFAGSSSTTKGTTTASSFSVTGTLIDLATSTALPLTPGGSKGFKPKYTFPQGKVQFLTTFSKNVGKTPVSGSFGINSTAISALPAVKTVSSCNLNLKKDKASGVASFNLLCQNWRVQLAPYVAGDLTAQIVFKQATGKAAVSIKATAPLTSARIF